METALQKQEAQKEQTGKPNLTGIPTQMKLDFEKRSGLSFDDVRVHYNSEKPAQLQALAYTQGTQVYVASGQERHLAHELGHVVQQKMGRVRPTRYIGGIPLNDDRRLEHEADMLSIQRMPAPTKSGNGVAQLWRPPFDDNEVLFASAHGGKAGSIYFRNGRIRLMHPHGPEVSQRRDENNIKRHLVLINGHRPDTRSRLYQEVYRLIKIFYDIHSRGANEAGLNRYVNEIEGYNKYGIKIKVLDSDPGNIQEAVTEQESWTESRLFEVYFKDGRLSGSHPSRGGIEKLGPLKKEMVSKLFFAIEMAQRIGRAAQEQYNMANPLDLKLELELEAPFRVLWDEMTGGKLDPDLADILIKMGKQLKENGTDLIQVACEQAQQEEEPERKAKRFGGYIGNKLLRASGIVEELAAQGVRVDAEEDD